MIETLVEIEHKQDFEEQGFYSKTYLGYDKRLLREVAVKDILQRNVSSKEDFERYFEEAQKLSIAKHPRVLPVYFVGIDHNHDDEGFGTPRIVTKFLRNGTLNGYLKTIYEGNRTLSIDSGIRFAHDILQGMSHLHSLNILHLDLKASNVFIGDDNKLVIADFGQAQFMKDEILMKVNDIYPIINPPENIRDRGMDKTSDIYQFGVLMYCIFNYDKYRKALDNTYGINTEVLIKFFKERADRDTEEFNTFKENAKQLNRDIKAGSFPNREDYHIHIPKKLRGVINRCMDTNVSNRYNNFYQVQTELNEFVFPKGVVDLHLDLGDNRVVFKKDNKDCSILAEQNGENFNLTPHKGTQCKRSLIQPNVSKTKLAQELFKLVEAL